MSSNLIKYSAEARKEARYRMYRKYVGEQRWALLEARAAAADYDLFVHCTLTSFESREVSV